MNVFIRPVFWGLFSVFVVLSTICANADTTRTQTISLHKGWNAVYLQVTPTYTTPSDVFAGTPVGIVATYFGATTSAQYLQDPSSTQWKQEGWGVWYAPSRTDAFLSTLNGIVGNRAYLIFSKADFTWTVTGAVTFTKIRWKGNAF